MLDFADLPYEYFPPRRRRLIAWLLARFNGWRYLPRTQRIASVTVTGHDTLRQRIAAGDRLLFVPNHPTHADAAIFIEATRQAGVAPSIMAAYDVFLRSRRDAWVMQTLGCFSVDREGSDPRSIKQAAAVLMDGRHPLTVFAEGNVYLQNNRVTPLTDGAAFLALRARAEVARQGGRVVVVPVAIKATHRADVRRELLGQMRELAQRLDVTLDEAQPPIDALRALGVAALRRNLKARGFDVPTAETLPQVIQHAAGDVLTRLEAKLDISAGAGDALIDRVRKVRRMIHEVRTDPQRVADHAAAATWADEAMLAYRIASYGGQYVAERPTLDRIAETVEKLTEDVHRTMTPPWAAHDAFVRFCEPIELTCDDGDERKRLRQAVRELTADCETAIQTSLDALNALIEAGQGAGARLWVEPLGASVD